MLGKTIMAGVTAYASVGTADLAPTPLSRLIKAIAANTGEGVAQVACEDPQLVRVMRREGLTVAEEAKVAWASSEEEVRTFAQQGKLVMCANPDWVRSGASIVVQVEGGRPVYIVHLAPMRQSGVYVRAAVLHYAKERR